MWPPVEEYFDKIEKDISNNYNIIHSVDIELNNMGYAIDKIYELDVRCHKPNLIHKVNFFKKYSNNVRLILLPLEPQYDDQHVSISAINLKENYRSMYRDRIPDYIRDVIIHVSDNNIEAKNILKYILNI